MIFKSRRFADGWARNVEENSAVRKELLCPILDRLLGPLEGRTVLDAGCGEGFSTRLLSKKGAERIIGADINPFLLRIARERFKEARFTQASIHDLPFESDYFDRILCCNALMNVPDDQAESAVKEFWRVLRGTGRLVVSIIHPLYNLFANQSDASYDKMRAYGLSEEIRVSTIPGFADFAEYRRPLCWYMGRFVGTGFRLMLFDEVFISRFDGISERHLSRLGLPIFAVFSFEKDAKLF